MSKIIIEDSVTTALSPTATPMLTAEQMEDLKDSPFIFINGIKYKKVSSEYLDESKFMYFEQVEK